MLRVRHVLVLISFALLWQGTLVAQSHRGDVVGSLSGSVHKYHGEFSDDMFGPGAALSLRYAALDRLWIEARCGLGEYRWKITDAKLARYAEYFGQSAQIGDLYPGSLTAIEAENESRLTTADLLVSYVLVDNIPASPFLTVGLGLVNTAPSNSSEHSALPNYEEGSYPHSVLSILIGGGVHIPISRSVGLLLRAERRFVFSEYLDDVAFNGMNDALSSFYIGFTYRFHESRSQDGCDSCYQMCCEERCIDNCEDECKNVKDCTRRCLDMMCICCSGDCAHCCAHCCCCCCCKDQNAGAAPTGGGDPTPAPPSPPGEPSSGGGPKPEPMEVPCPGGQHRECFGPPGFGICVDDGPPIGPEKIRWDLSRRLEDGSDLRETEGRWYRRQLMENGSYHVSKGLLPFEATECKECKEKLRLEKLQ